MREKQPYKFWTRGEMFQHLKRQAISFNFSDYYIDIIEIMVFDKNWNPMKDFNGCNIVQDHLHPFLPCFVHDYEWIMIQGRDDAKAFTSDLQFYNNLRRCGFNKVMATIYFLGVRAGWFLKYRWKK